MLATLDHVDRLSGNISSFWFRLDQQLVYTAGQFIEMYLPHENPDDRGEKHWFTLSSSPTEELLCVTTKFAVRSSTFKLTLTNLKPGNRVSLSEAMGDFVLPKDISIPLVFVAGGMGVTPYRSMIKWLTDSRQKRKLQLILAASTPEDIIFDSVFKAYGLKPDVIVSQPSFKWTGQSGKLSAERILGFIGGASAKRIYLSGPEQLVEILEKELKSHGVESAQLVGDFFPGYPDV